MARKFNWSVQLSYRCQIVIKIYYFVHFYKYFLVWLLDLPQFKLNKSCTLYMYFTCGLNTYVHIDVIANRYSNTAVLISKKFKNKVCLKNEITTFGFIFKKGVIIFFFLKKKNSNYASMPSRRYKDKFVHVHINCNIAKYHMILLQTEYNILIKNNFKLLLNTLALLLLN